MDMRYGDLSFLQPAYVRGTGVSNQTVDRSLRPGFVYVKARPLVKSRFAAIAVRSGYCRQRKSLTSGTAGILIAPGPDAQAFRTSPIIETRCVPHEVIGVSKRERIMAAMKAAAFAFLLAAMFGVFYFKFGIGRYRVHHESVSWAEFFQWRAYVVAIASVAFAGVTYASTFRALKPRQVICPKCLVTYDNRKTMARCPHCNVATEAMPSFRKQHPSRFMNFDEQAGH